MKLVEEDDEEKKAGGCGKEIDRMGHSTLWHHVNMAPECGRRG